MEQSKEGEQGVGEVEPVAPVCVFCQLSAPLEVWMERQDWSQSGVPIPGKFYVMKCTNVTNKAGLIDADFALVELPANADRALHP